MDYTIALWFQLNDDHIATYDNVVLMVSVLVGTILQTTSL